MSESPMHSNDGMIPVVVGMSGEDFQKVDLLAVSTSSDMVDRKKSV